MLLVLLSQLSRVVSGVNIPRVPFRTCLHLLQKYVVSNRYVIALPLEWLQLLTILTPVTSLASPRPLLFLLLLSPALLDPVARGQAQLHQHFRGQILRVRQV